MSECKQLKVNNLPMNTLSKEKYLGNIITSDGKINENISERCNKSIGTVNQILSMLKELHFGYYYFEMAIFSEFLFCLMACSLVLKHYTA